MYYTKVIKDIIDTKNGQPYGDTPNKTISQTYTNFDNNEVALSSVVRLLSVAIIFGAFYLFHGKVTKEDKREV